MSLEAKVKKLKNIDPDAFDALYETLERGDIELATKIIEEYCGTDMSDILKPIADSENDFTLDVFFELVDAEDIDGIKQLLSEL